VLTARYFRDGGSATEIHTAARGVERAPAAQRGRARRSVSDDGVPDGVVGRTVSRRRRVADARTRLRSVRLTRTCSVRVRALELVR
jgi:hypothetical protein